MRGGCTDRHPLGFQCESDEHTDEDGQVDGHHFKFGACTDENGRRIHTLIEWKAAP